MNKPLYVNGLCLWFVREIEKIDVVGLHRFQSSLPPGFVAIVHRGDDSSQMRISLLLCPYLVCG